MGNISGKEKCKSQIYETHVTVTWVTITHILTMYHKVCLLLLGNWVNSKLVVDLEQVDSLGVELIEKEGTLLETLVRETGCEGVLVRCNILYMAV